MKILHPTDFSTAAENARLLAVDLQQRLDAELVLVHVIDPREDDLFVHPLTPLDALNEELRHQLAALEQQRLEQVRARLEDLAPPDAAVLVRTGNPLRELLTLLPDFDLVVMGAHGDSPLDHVFLGGNAGRLVRRSPIPVLAARQESQSRRVGHILLATDFGEASREAWQLCRRYAAAGGIRLSVAHVIEAQPQHGAGEHERGVREALTEFAADADELRIGHGNPVEVLPELAREVGADVIAIGVRHHPAALGLLLGSRADALLRSSPVPILSVPSRRA